MPKSIVRNAFSELSEVMTVAEDQWILDMLLMEHRSELHNKIDILLRKKEKFDKGQ